MFLDQNATITMKPMAINRLLGIFPLNELKQMSNDILLPIPPYFNLFFENLPFDAKNQGGFSRFWHKVDGLTSF